jgi:hypothetical protein
MKKLTYAIFFAVALLCLSAKAQVSFGIRAGLNTAYWDGDVAQSAQRLLDLTGGVADGKTRQGFHAGIYANIPIGERFAIEPGILYSQKGARVIGNFSSQQLEFLNARTEITNKAHYIDIPVVAKVYLVQGLHLFAGPQLSYLVDNKIKTEASVLGFSVLNRTFNAKNGFQDLDVALTGGLGYTFENGINLRAAYDYGLRRIDERNSFDTYNRVFKFSLGYEF